MILTEARCEGHFYFDPEDPIYAEHFPGNPVVPGSMIIHAFTMAASASCADLVPKGVRDFRFKRFLPPGRYAYRIQPKTNGMMACALLDNQTTVVTGIIVTAPQHR